MRHKIQIMAAMAALQVQPLPGDQLLLDDGSHLSGSLRGIDASGRVFFEHPAARGSLVVQGERIAKVTFEGRNPAPPAHDTRLLLVNGDTLPCELKAIDSSQVHVGTSYAGDFRIPRDQVSSAQLGIQPLETIYQGPDDLSGWKVDEGWHYADGSLVSTARGSIHREIDGLPSSFSLSFQLEWNHAPNLQVYFCSSSESIGGDTDRYYLQFNSAGFELKRQSSEGRSYRTLGSINRRPEQIRDRRVEVEIRFDRRRREIMLFIDRVLQDRYRDQVGQPPVGNLLMFYSSSGEEGAHRIHHIAVRSWDVDRDHFQGEDRSKEGEDSLIDREGQRFSGTLMRTLGTGDDRVIQFKSPHFPEPLEIGVARVTTLFFPSEVRRADDETPLVVGIGGVGSLSARSYAIDGGQIRIDHPILGKVALDRDSVTTLKRREDPASDEPGGEEP